MKEEQWDVSTVVAFSNFAIATAACIATAICPGLITSAVKTTRKAKLPASLTEQMLKRGMSAGEIKDLLESREAGCPSAVRESVTPAASTRP